MSENSDSINKERKRGALSRQDWKDIKRLAAEGCTVEQIADIINRNVDPVLKYMKENHLTHQGMSNHQQDMLDALERLRSSTIYKQAKKCFTADELRYYEELTVELYVQFKGDFVASEASQIHTYVELMVNINRNRQDKFKYMQLAEKEATALEEQMEKNRLGLLTSEEIDDMHQMEMRRESYVNSAHSCENNYNKMIKAKEDILVSLKADRQARVKSIEGDKSTWHGYLRQLQDERKREADGREAAIHKLAKEKVYKQFAEYHKYGDGTLDRPFLNADTVMLDEIEEGEDNGENR